MEHSKNYSIISCDDVKKRWQAWWECNIYDRVLLQLSSPKIKIDDDKMLDSWGDRYLLWESRPDAVEGTAWEQWMDIGYMIKRTKYEIDNTAYFAESIPLFSTNWTFGHALLFGAGIKSITKDALWLEHLDFDENPYKLLEYEANGYWRQWILNATKEILKNAEDKYFIQPAYGTGAADSLLMLAGTEKLLTSIIDNPEWVKKNLSTITKAIIELYKRIFEIIASPNGYINWMGCWSDAPSISLDCDTAAMVSADAFKDIMLPSIIELSEISKYRIYHLDGTDQLKILDTLLDLKDINAIQWAPGIGKENIMQWIPLIKKIQDKKKAIIIYCTPEEVLPVLREVSPLGLCIFASCRSVLEAETLFNHVNKFHKTNN